MLFIFFVLATFFSQITMLNLLIAIMGDTFDRITQDRELNATQTKLELMSELYQSLGEISTEQETKNFMFIA